jgi:UTP--glucose-1-phosphate uridylyltransferase
MKDGEEIQLTDAIKKMSTAEVCYGKLIEGNRFDIGTHDDYISLINIMNRPTKN